MFWKLFEYSVCEDAIIEAPCKIVWAIVSDLDNYSQYLSLVESTERCEGSKEGPIQVGTKLMRKLNIGGKPILSRVTVSAIDKSDDDSYPKTIAIFADNFTEGLTGRVCWTVSREADGKSRLEVTSTMLPERLWLKVGGRFGTLVCCFASLTAKILRNDIHEFANAAESRKEKL